MAEIRLIATDLDGTLLRSDKTISPRSVDAITAAKRAGIPVVAATGRQAFGLPLLLPPAGIDGPVVTSNGAVGVHLGTGEVLFEDTLDPETAAQLVSALRSEFPGVRFASVRDAGRSFVGEPEYIAMTAFADHIRHQFEMMPRLVGDVVAAPSVKLVARHPEIGEHVLLRALLGLGLTGFTATVSGAPFLEIQGPGVTKASGLAQLAAAMSVDAAEVLALGDALNDVEMLAWAGIGVAMGNAAPEVLAVADRITATNEQDGFALVLEALLSGELGQLPAASGAAPDAPAGRGLRARPRKPTQ